MLKECVYRWTIELGIDVTRMLRAALGFMWYLRSYRKFKILLEKQPDGWSLSWPYPCLADRSEQSGGASGHYFHQDLWVAQNIFRLNPKAHIDVGSRIDGFVAHVATFRKILVIDIRSLTVSVNNIHFKQANACDPCPQELHCSADSVSCLHALEHFGLGRYGDSLDPEGHKKGAEFLTALVAPGGLLYISVPIGPQRIEYNAHRVFSAIAVVEIFSAAFELDNFCWVDDAGNLHEPIAWTSEELRNSFGCHYGCGIFTFRRKIQPLLRD